MTELIVVEKIAEWQRLKALVLDSVSSPITRRVYNMALDEFIAWYRQEPRPGFTKATVSAWRVSLEARGLGSSSIIIRMSAIRKLAVEAADNGLLAPELAAGIARVKSAKSVGIRVGNWLSRRQAQTLLGAPDTATVKGLRDRAILAVLLGCGLRRSEVAALTFAHVQQRDGRWCIVDLVASRIALATLKAACISPPGEFNKKIIFRNCVVLEISSISASKANSSCNPIDAVISSTGDTLSDLYGAIAHTRTAFSWLARSIKDASVSSLKFKVFLMKSGIGTGAGEVGGDEGGGTGCGPVAILVNPPRRAIIIPWRSRVGGS
jgi:hypothetical protein